MKNLKFFSAFALSILLLSISTTGCDPDKKQPATLSSFFEAMEKPLEIVNFKAEDGLSFTSQSLKTSFSLPPSSLVDENGNAITGTVKLEFREIYTKGDMIRYNRPTETKDGQLLESGGEVYLHLTQNDKPLHLAANKKIRLYLQTNDPKNDMDVFYGIEDPLTDLFSWEDDGTPDVPNVNVSLDSSITGDFNYYFFSDSLEWINCDRFFDIPENQKTTVCANLADGFTKENTFAYVVYNDRNSVAYLYNTNIEDILCAANVPLGDAVTIVSVSVQGDEGEEVYFLAHQSAMVTADLQVDLTPVATSLGDIETYLGGF